MFVIGTAGHIDHGKSTLVRALTGIDPDRLREEKEREMTIDLGFAWLKLPGGREVSVVDVPGHERFIKNMLAGVGGIDLALLVVAANEGVMPQTREHLAILDLLQVKRGIIVITMKDLVDEDILTLVRMEIEELIAPTSLAGCPVVAVSSVTREGLDELVQTIDRLLDKTEPRKDLGRPRLPVDRVFTITGAGTIVTGTLIDGSLSVADEVEIVPRGIKSRIRGLQTHKSKLNTAAPGSRVAANLVGVNVADIRRGDVVTRAGWLSPARMVTVRLRLLSSLPRPLRHNTPVTLFTGSAETEARVRLLEAEQLKPGGQAWAQLVLEEPVAVVAGDRFIIRSPMDTIGGGEVVDTQAKRLARFKPAVIKNLEARGGADAVMAYLEAKQPIELAVLAAQAGLSMGETGSAVQALAEQGRVVTIGQGEHALHFTAAGWQDLTRKAVSALEDYHRRFPARDGMPRMELVSKLKLGGQVLLILQRLVGQGSIVEDGAVVHLPGYQIKLSASQEAQVQAFLKALSENPYSPPTDDWPPPDLLNMLAEQRQIVKVSDTVAFAAPAYDAMVKAVTDHVKQHDKITLAETRDLFKTSRKYAQALLEHLDAKKVTRRVGDDRVLC